MSATLAGLLADKDAESPAIGAPGRPWLTYGGLRSLSLDLRRQLRRHGIAAHDRVAIVLPNGPEMAAAFVAIAQSATTAPLNPAYRQEEFAFYLEDLRAKAVVVAAGAGSPAIAAAEAQGIAVLRLEGRTDGPAGSFTLSGPDQGGTEDTGEPGAGSTALILHTSGTTSRPKIVPLLQSNIVASARHIAAALALTPADRCLNVMPLFHIHGLIAAVSA
ncbi:MAG: AMP-binding protein, partial [Aestuariivirga sp.]